MAYRNPDEERKMLERHTQAVQKKEEQTNLRKSLGKSIEPSQQEIIESHKKLFQKGKK